MLLAPEDKKLFPNFSKFVYKTAPRLATTKVVKEMAKLTGLEAGSIRNALKAGSPPTVVIVSRLQCRGSNGAALGCFRHDMPEQIEVSEELVSCDETGECHTASWEDRQVGPIILLHSHVTALHELVHWADFKQNRRATEVADYHDIASKWEWEVFRKYDGSMVHKGP
jgi:hypothetical protein